MHRGLLGVLVVIVTVCLAGCRTQSPVGYATERPPPVDYNGPQMLPSALPTNTNVQQVSYTVAAESAPPRVRDIGALTPWPMSLDEAVRIALGNSPVISGAGGRTLGTAFDPAIFAIDPNVGPEAALTAFDTQLTSSVSYRGGKSVLSSSAFGIHSQPTNTAQLGLARTFRNGTRVGLGGFGGHDTDLAGGFFAAYGADLRHPLLRGAGTEFNLIAGPNATPGRYRGIWIAQLETNRANLELEQAVRDLVRDVATAYWALYFTYHDLDAKKAALERARQTWHRERKRVAEKASPPDVEAIARQQYYSADAAVQNAISGTGRGGTGVFDAEMKLRTMLALPAFDGRLIRPTARPLEEELRFDWNEAVQLANCRRIEVRKQRLNVEKRELELKAAHNLRRPKVDIVGQYRRPAGDPRNRNISFSGALQTWQIGIEYSRMLGDRRENAAIRSAELLLSRDRALLNEQRQQLSVQLRSAFTELDRSFGVTQSLVISRDAARIRQDAEQKRHAAGDANIDSVLEAQIRATRSETSMLRSLVDYNLAVINLHYARGTLLEMLGVGFLPHATEQQMSFAQNHPSIYAEAHGRRTGGSSALIARPPSSNRPASQPSRPLLR